MRGAALVKRAATHRRRWPAMGACALIGMACGGVTPPAERVAAPAPATAGAAPPGAPAVVSARDRAAAPGEQQTPPSLAPSAPLPRLAADASGAAPPGTVPEACGPFECWRFDLGERALSAVLAEEPLAIGIGEAHALAGSEAVASTARRFASALLPSLAGRASHLVVELLNPDPRCASTTREVRKRQEPVTAPQSTQNQNDYVALGQRARALGIEPFVLSPSCDEFRAIAGAGDAAIDVMLQTIARVTSRMLRGALAKNQSAGRPALVIGYGGALHNDIEPAEAKASWSYGPELATFTRGRYVELDLIVREFIKDTDVWRALPWYEHFDPNRFEGEWLVMRTAPHRYVLFFPRDRSATSVPAEPPSTP